MTQACLLEGFGSPNILSLEERKKEGGREWKETAAYPDVCQSQSTLTTYTLATSHHPVQNAGSQAQPQTHSIKICILMQSQEILPISAHTVIFETHGRTLLFSKCQAFTDHPDHSCHIPSHYL